MLTVTKLSEKVIVEKITSTDGDAHAVLREQSQAKTSSLNGGNGALPHISPAPSAVSNCDGGFELTIFKKTGGPLTKSVGATSEGKLITDSSGCSLWWGWARRARFNSLHEFADALTHCPSNEAFGLGRLRSDLKDEVAVVTQGRLKSGGSDIARTRKFIDYWPGPGVVPIDHDSKGMPPDVRERLETAGGLWNALTGIVPELAGVGHVIRASTSAGLRNGETGEPIRGSDGKHVYLSVSDVSDAQRFLDTLHDRCWLAGFGWYLVSEAGVPLERSIVDKSVGAPERLVLEGAPVLVPPLEQDAEVRRARVIEGGVLDTVAACRPLSVIEKSQRDELQRKDRPRYAAEAQQKRDAYVHKQGGTVSAVKAAGDGVLLPDFVLPFDDDDLAGMTVGDVLEDPARFVDCTMADPLDGIEYGSCKAKILMRADGSVFIHSLAHGRRTDYAMRWDFAVVKNKIEKADHDHRLDTFLRYRANAELSKAEEEALVLKLAEDRLGTSASIRRLEREARAESAKKAREQWKEQRKAERRDPRPLIDVPARDAPWLPQVEIVEEALGGSRAVIPPMREICWSRKPSFLTFASARRSRVARASAWRRSARPSSASPRPRASSLSASTSRSRPAKAPTPWNGAPSSRPPSRPPARLSAPSWCPS